MSRVAITRPRVFISSTIADLRDIRSALRFWLEQSGYDVQLSEYNDFDRRQENDAWEACFGNVSTCDYYVLLIGNRRGSWYNEGEHLTVTRQEFRVASQASLSRPLGLFIFIREEVEIAVRQWEEDGRPNSGSPFVDDPAFTSEFIAEVAAPPAADRGARWRYNFADFRDIVDALRTTLRLDTDIDRRLLRENILGEVLYNLSLLVTKTKRGNIFPHHKWTATERKEVTIRKEDIGQQIWLASKLIGRLGLIPLGHPGRALRRDAIAEGLRRGLFLSIDSQTGEITETEAHKELRALHDDIVSLVKCGESHLQDSVNTEFLLLALEANRGRLGSGTDVDADKLTMLLALHDTEEDVFKGVSRFAQWLLGAAESPSIIRNPRSPIEGASEAIEAERVTSAELKWALAKGIQPFGPYVTPESKELALRGVDSAVEQLRAIFPPSTSDEELADIAREVFESLIVEAFPGEDANLCPPGEAGSD